MPNMTYTELKQAVESLSADTSMFYNAGNNTLAATALNPETNLLETAVVMIAPEVMLFPHSSWSFPAHISDFVFDTDNVFSSHGLRRFATLNDDGTDSTELVNLKMHLEDNLHVCSYVTKDKDIALNLAYGAARGIITECTYQKYRQNRNFRCRVTSESAAVLTLTQSLYQNVMEMGIEWDGWELMVSAIATEFAKAFVDPNQSMYAADFRLENFIINFWEEAVSNYCASIANRAINGAIWGIESIGEDDWGFFKKSDFQYDAIRSSCAVSLARYVVNLSREDDEDIPF